VAPGGPVLVKAGVLVVELEFPVPVQGHPQFSLELGLGILRARDLRSRTEDEGEK
jgi:hypothetical protein